MQLLGSSVVHYGAASAAVSFVGSVLVVRFGGVLTASLLNALKAEISRRHGAGAEGVIADYCGAVLALSDADVERMMIGQEPENLPHLPAVVVAGAADSERLHRQAVKSAVAHALPRAVAQSYEQALALVLHLQPPRAAAGDVVRQLGS